ncbi:carbon-nitrogen hydrolase family protein [Sphingomonas sp.]|uniref:carbon-nitrogen hydrolase family protein n=1 Tax=Sphingomonas sp. TaxID=28214 RepID=UPI0028AD2F07|nr:carbon-nitrogen hydrolase family protein [Sphingomonas sp.]
MRIAAVQCHPVLDDPEQTIAAIVDRLRWADTEQVDLLLFPEAWLLGHAYDATLVRAHAEIASALALPALCARIAGFSSTLVLGVFEQMGAHTSNSAVVIEAGRIVGRNAKAHPNEDGVTPGTGFPIFLRSGLRYGINICNDSNFPHAAARTADQGAGLILYPLNNLLRPETAARWRERSLANLVARPREIGCWVASADVAGMANDRISYGCTILSPRGDILARVPELQEGAVLYDLPIEDPRAA